MTVERRVDAADALGDRRVGGEERFEEAGRAREEHVLGFEFGGRGFAARAGEPGDLAEGRGEAERIAGELDGGSVGEILALTRDRGLDEAGEEDAPEPDEDDHQARDGQRQGVVLAA